MIVKMLIAIIVIFIFPELLGLLILKFWKEQKNNVILAFILGYIVEFAIAQLISVPLIFKGASLTRLVQLYMCAISGLSAVSLFVNVNRVKDIVLDVLSNIKKLPIMLTLLFVVLVGIQLMSLVRYSHTDSDDAVYVATATAAVQTDTLYKYSATTGTSNPMEQTIMRYRLGPFPLYYAIMSRILNIHPAIIAHLVLPLIFVPIVYMVYWLFSKEFFKDTKSIMLFMIVICLLHIFSYYSGKNNMVLVLFRIWQGKAILANIILPLILILFIYAQKENMNFISIVSIILTILAGSFTTTMNIAMAPATLMIYMFVYELVKLIQKETSFKQAIIVAVKSSACCLPCLIYGLMYFI